MFCVVFQNANGSWDKEVVCTATASGLKVFRNSGRPPTKDSGGMAQIFPVVVGSLRLDVKSAF